ncbi:DUF1566 domain-containing protein [Aidingimonas halophila]|uniref:DUF1566 domain-containing protein n=1 Tax=Aidingimonas halophila TaxID=574349 RepID=A0A1H2RGJ4_9GAMM|nr:DUF1566 domain-containing protein [Aidingimonas halophila]GHC19253.1 hypothetical protein GCM10008094_06530 [Aidingimonas halophila]SDW18572.1 Protein of unknown function [Aidingimonas halophila]
MNTRDTITLQAGAARIEMPTADAVQQILANLSHGQPEPQDRRSSPPEIGKKWHGQGGIYAGLMRNPDGLDYHLLVAEDGPGEAEDLEWGSRGEDEPEARGEWDGQANTLSLARSEHPHPVIDWVANLHIAGRMDWYLPARRELALCYANVPELFYRTWYWSSTQYSSNGAWGQGFDGGGQGGIIKFTELRARAVRRVFDH